MSVPSSRVGQTFLFSEEYHYLVVRSYPFEGTDDDLRHDVLQLWSGFVIVGALESTFSRAEREGRRLT